MPSTCGPAVGIALACSRDAAWLNIIIIEAYADPSLMPNAAFRTAPTIYIHGRPKK